MKSKKYLASSGQTADDMTYYEEQLLLQYDDYLDGAFEAELPAGSRCRLDIGPLQEDLEDDFESEYDENDWEEMDSDSDPAGEYGNNEELPGAFLIRN